MTSTAAVLEQVVADLDRVLGADGSANLSDAERIRVLKAAGDAFRRVEAVIVDTVSSAEPGFEDRCGCRSMNELVQRVLRTDAPGAARVIKTAALVARPVSVTTGERLPARWPAMRGGLLDGVVGIAGMLAATTPIEQAGPRIGLSDRLRADAALAAYARGEEFEDPDADADAGPDREGDIDGDAGAGPDAGTSATAPAATPEDVRLFAQQLAMILDPDGAEPTDRNAQQQRFLTIGRRRNGLHPLHGNLLPDVAAQLQAIIDAQCNPKTDGPPAPGVAFHDSDAAETGADDPLNSDPRHVIDPRTATQKRHDALAAALGIAARHDSEPTLGGAAPTLVVQVDAKDFATGTGWATLPGSHAPVPLSVAAHTACTGTIQRVLFDEGRSSASPPPTGSSPPHSGARSPSATANASSPAATSRHPGARSITSPNTPAADPPTPTTVSRCAGGTTAPSTDPGGRSA